MMCVIRFSSKFIGWNEFSKHLEYKIGDSALEVLKCHRDLGILVDSEFKFNSHIFELVQKAAGLSNNLL